MCRAAAAAATIAGRNCGRGRDLTSETRNDRKWWWWLKVLIFAEEEILGARSKTDQKKPTEPHQPGNRATTQVPQSPGENNRERERTKKLLLDGGAPARA